MYSSEDLAKQIKLISQNAWRQEGNTTLNSMVEYIVREALALVMELIIEQESRIQALEAQIGTPNLTQVFNQNMDLKEPTNGKDGGVSQPQGNTQSSTTAWTWPNANPRKSS